MLAIWPFLVVSVTPFFESPPYIHLKIAAWRKLSLTQTCYNVTSFKAPLLDCHIALTTEVYILLATWMNRDLNLKEMLLFFSSQNFSLKTKQANKQILLTITVIEIPPWIFTVLQIYDRCSAQLIKNSDIELKHIKLNTLVKFEFPNKSFQYARSSLCIMIHIQLHDLIFFPLFHSKFPLSYCCFVLAVEVETILDK